MASATEIAVNCDNLGETIQGALDGLDVTGPHLITVSGTCFEAVTIGNRERVTIETDGATIIDATGILDPDGNPVPAINVGGSQNIVISGPDLTLTGGSIGLRVARGSEVAASDLRSHDNQFQGVAVVADSFLRLSTATVDHNGAAGIRVDSSTVALDGGMIIEDNTGAGIGGAAANINLNDAAGSNSISNNGGNGLAIADSSRANLSGDTNIQSNGAFGALVFHTSSMNMFGGSVDGNTLVGINCQETAHCELGNLTVSNNGGGGIRSADGADTYIDGGVTVTDNTGIGVEAELRGQISSLGGNNFDNNTSHGVRVRRLSLGHFFATDTITGNGGETVICDKTSLIVGDLSGVSKVKCKVEEEIAAPGPTLTRHRHPE